MYVESQEHCFDVHDSDSFNFVAYSRGHSHIT